MYKSWINDKKLSSTYVNGVKSFLNFANQNNKRPDKMLQNSYRQWRNALKEYYDDLKIRNIGSRKKSPRPEVTLEKWLSIWEWLESEKFKIRSNQSTKNREKMTSIHNFGWISYQTHYENILKIGNARLNCLESLVNKDGELSDPKDQADYAIKEMVALKEASLFECAEPKSDNQILEEVLGFRSGYQKGMGYGVKIARRSKILYAANEEPGLSEKLNETQATVDATQSKFETTQTALGYAEDKISSLSK
ncbi:hypothetical protein OROGR_005936 [Orobanche gracilis]